MVKTMKRGVSLLFVLSLLVSMLVIPAKATNSSQNVTVNSSKNIQYVTVNTDKSFLGLKTTTVTITNTSKYRSVSLYKNIGYLGYAYQGDLYPGCSKSFTAKANGAIYSFMLQCSSGSGSANVRFNIKNGY